MTQRQLRILDRIGFAAITFAIAAYLVALIASQAHAAQPFTACDADRAKFCPTTEGVQATVACLQAHRASLSKACSALLLESGK